MEVVGDSTYYRYRDRGDERARSFAEIRHHPMATYDTVAHIVKHMRDAETMDGGFSKSEDADKAWEELRTHLDAMMAQAIEFTPDPHDHSTRAEWLHERDGGSEATPRQ